MSLRSLPSKYLMYAMNPSNEVVFLDTSEINLESPKLMELRSFSCGSESTFQIRLIANIIDNLQRIGIKNKQIACITSYNTYRIQLIKYFAETNDNV